MTTPATTVTAIITIQVAAGLRWPFSMSLMTEFCSAITPPLPMLPAELIKTRSTPDRASWPASVTTNDGILSQAMMNPWSAP